jgi:hypothetical protein
MHEQIMADLKRRKQARRLVPGSARVIVQLYRAEDRSYQMAAGMSAAGITIASKGELDRLWSEINNVILSARWRDMNQGEQHQGQIPA